MQPQAPRSPARALLTVLRAQLWLLGAVYLACEARFLAAADGVTPRFTALAQGPYLGTVVWAQLRLLPAYLLVAVMAALLATPALARLGALRARPLPRLALVAAADALLLALALGPLMRDGAGVFDAVARKLPRLDLYALQRWHLLDGLAAGFWVVAALAATHWARALWATRAGRPWVLAFGAAVVPVGALAIGSPAPRGPARDVGRPNVLVVATDSWRWDRVGVHGAARPGLTPNVDAFAQDALDLRNLHVATASTLESWTTLLTGQFPPTHGLRSMYPSREEVARVEANPDRLPALLARLGYDTFVSSDWAGNHFAQVDLGFARRDVGSVQNFRALLHEATVLSHPLVPLLFGGAPGLLGDALVPGRRALTATVRPELLVEQLFDAVDQSQARGKPFFGVLFASPTHLPYNARYPFNVRWADPAYDGPHRFQVEVGAHELITTGFSPALPPEVVRHVRDLYDGAVSDFDATFGAVRAGLEARGLWDSTVVVVTTDHGEDLYDPGSTLGHGTNFFGGDQSTRVPFFLRVPGPLGPLRAGEAVDALARSADVAPTLLELLHLPVPASMEGVSLAPHLRREAPDPQLTAFAETCYLFFPKAKAMTVLDDAERARVVELSGAADTLTVDPGFDDALVLRPEWRQAVVDAKDRMVRTGTWKLVEIPSRGAPILRLYDLAADPEQRHDLAGLGLKEEAALRALLARAWRGDLRALGPGSARLGAE